MIIAVVEDDPHIGELIRGEICDEGNDFQGFTTAETFLEEVNILKPDLVYLDLMLPGIDGLECLHWLRQMLSMLRCPVVVVTALNESAKRHELQQLGALYYILKPDLFGQLPQLLTSLTEESLET
ncbi:MAG: response regulator [Cyanobacteriota bacterium]|nr:response regulator [Cyanobacteriota bacterium]